MITEQYKEQIRGTLSCYDRIILRGKISEFTTAQDLSDKFLLELAGEFQGFLFAGSIKYGMNIISYFLLQLLGNFGQDIAGNMNLASLYLSPGKFWVL